MLNKILENKYVDFILRHLTWLIGLVAGIYVLKVIPGILEFIVFTAMMESLAIGLSMTALYAYTKINFTKQITCGSDGILDAAESAALLKVTGNIFIGVHLLIGLCTLVFYSGVFIK